MTSKDRAILKMRGVQFQYPTAESAILNDVSVQVSLNSRVGVLGPNGAHIKNLQEVLRCKMGVADGSSKPGSRFVR